MDVRQLRVALAVIAAVACGGDSTPPGDSGAPVDSPGLDAPAADGGPACVAIAPRAASDSTSVTSGPRIASNASGFGVIWADSRDSSGVGMDDELYFATLDASGQTAVTDVRVTSAPGEIAGEDLAWNGLDYGVAFGEARMPNGAFFVRLGSTGVVGAEVPLGPLGTPPSIAPSAAAFGVASTDAGDVTFALDPTAAGAPVPLGPGSSPSVAGTATGWAVAFHTGERVWLALLDSAGARMGADLPVSEGVGVRADIAAGPSGFGVAWLDSIGGDVHFARLDPSGTVRGSEIPLTTDMLDHSVPAVAAGQGGYLVAWVTSANQLVAIFVDTDGTMSAPMTVSPNALSMAFRPLDVTFDGTRFALVWIEPGGEGNQLFFATLCP